MHKTTCMAALAAAWLLAGAAQAQDFYDNVRLGSAVREGGRAGGALVVGRAYKGSDESRVALVPVVEYRWANGFFAGVGSGVGYEFLREPGTTAGVRLTPDFGRRESRSAALTGMGDIGVKPEIGLYLNHALPVAGLGVHASVRYGAGGDGLLGDIGIAYG
ncbi:MAG: MipA/OmpV family protein, partial [Rubrivivax sp.]